MDNLVENSLVENSLAEYPLDELLATHVCVADFIASMGLAPPTGATTLYSWLEQLPDEAIFDAGMERDQMLTHIARLIEEVRAMQHSWDGRVQSLTIIGGNDKTGQPENRQLTLNAGEIVCIVGPTGSGKSRLLGDIECLAQGDTPTGRRILIDGQVPDDERRYAPDRKLVAQLSQNMNFVVDMTVWEFIAMHARCRLVAEPDAMAARVIACANDLTGEKFSATTSVTQLSGGQTRALMIADAALLSASPVVLIDEIENAGVDRKRALALLVGSDKIVLISTHDPLLALRGDRRLVIRNGGIAEVLDTSTAERRNLARIEAVDTAMTDIRDRLRSGKRIDADIVWPATTVPETEPALKLLLERRSSHQLSAPGPDDAALANILQAAMRAPDFGHLRPYRFLAARGTGLDRLGLTMQSAAMAAGKPEQTIARAASMPHRAPLVIVAVASPKPSKTVALFDQQLSAASTVLMMQLAARAQQFDGVWRSGWVMYDRGFHALLGLADHEQIVGLLYLGTAAADDADGANGTKGVETAQTAPPPPAPEEATADLPSLLTWL